MLELYTSEGCSSCPPAEKWLSSLKESPALWKEFVPVAFHVDYWDYLGWQDPWSSKDFSRRQHAYAQSWRSDSVYTPGFILNGKEWRALSRPKDGPRSSDAKVGVLKVSSSDLKNWKVSFAPVSRSDGRYEVHAALLANSLTSEVKAGENRGRRLGHDFVAVGLIHKPLLNGGAAAEGEFTLLFPQNERLSQLGLAVWITKLDSLEPLQATGGFFPRH